MITRPGLACSIIYIFLTNIIFCPAAAATFENLPVPEKNASTSPANAFIAYQPLGLIDSLTLVQGFILGAKVWDRGSLELHYDYAKQWGRRYKNTALLVAPVLGRSFYFYFGPGLRQIDEDESHYVFGPGGKFRNYVATQDLVLDFAIGNRWRIGEHFLFGCDWFTILQPVKRLSTSYHQRDSSDTTMREKLKKKGDINARNPTWSLVNFYIGIGF